VGEIREGERAMIRARLFPIACAEVLLALVLQLVSLWSIFIVLPGKGTELGLGCGGLWIWCARPGDFAYHSTGLHYTGRTPARWWPVYEPTQRCNVSVGSRGFTVVGWQVSVPMYLLAVPGVAVGAIAGRPYVRCRRRNRGACDACGYDLVGLRAGECPECGTLLPPCASSTSQRA
jgi:hypothetical protein